jgi:hypothetical protein
MEMIRHVVEKLDSRVAHSPRIGRRFVVVLASLHRRAAKRNQPQLRDVVIDKANHD